MTAPMTEVVGIYGVLTNAMPPQGDCFMASIGNVCRSKVIGTGYIPPMNWSGLALLFF